MSLNHYVGEKMYILHFISVSIFKGSRLLFNIIIYLKAYERLPEFSGLIGKVFPGQLKPRYPIPEPRIQTLRRPVVSLERNKNGLREVENNGHLNHVPLQIIIVEPVS